MTNWDGVTEIICASFSSTGCLLIILSYWLFPSLRVFSGHLSFYLAISGLGTAFCLCLYEGSLKENGIICNIQGFGFIYFANVTIATASYISWVLYLVFIGNLGNNSKVEISRGVTVAIWSAPLVLASIPLVTDNYDEHAEVRICWIHSRGQDEQKAFLLQLFCFYLPLGVAMVFNLRVFALLFTHVLQATVSAVSHRLSTIK